MNKTSTEASSKRESIVIGCVTIVAALLRLQGLGQVGLTHFDEGIYALAGGWIFQRGGLAAIDPGLIPYAPPAYVILVGWAYQLLGASDVSAILVSILTATLTVPLVGQVARKTFGPGAGAAAATLAAFSGPHQVFSRMALTDPTFLLTWMLAWLAGIAFLRRPGWLGAIGLGIAVGLAQLTKYNGWLTGAIVAGAAGLTVVVDRDARSPGRLIRLFGFGAIAALIAALVYWPWFSFVERHGGYSALLAHQRSYLGGFDSWPANLLTQWGQENVLSSWYRPTSLYLAAFASALSAPFLFRYQRGFVAAVVLLIAASCSVNLGWWIGLFGSIAWFHSERIERRLFAVGWVTLAILTPFYHPYARLWLPIQAMGWVGFGFLPTAIPSFEAAYDQSPGRVWMVTLFVVPCCFLTMVLSIALLPLWDVGHPTNSLRIATANVLKALPPGARSVRLLARPPVIFYLSGRVETQRLPDLKSLSDGARPGDLAIVDEVQALQEPGGREALDRALGDWEVIKVEENRVGAATRLDIEPVSVVEDSAAGPSRLWLLRYSPRPIAPMSETPDEQP